MVEGWKVILPAPSDPWPEDSYQHPVLDDTSRRATALGIGDDGQLSVHSGTVMTDIGEDSVWL